MIKNFIVDRVVRGNMYDRKTNEMLWSLNQIQSPSLSMESETVDAVDALGTPIMSFDRSKSCTFSGENAIFDLKLLGQQVGTAAKNEERIIPVFEECEVKDGKVTLEKTPAEEIRYLYVLEEDGSVGETIYLEGIEDDEINPVEVPEGAKRFTRNDVEVVLTDIADGSRIFASYEYTGKSTYVVNKANEFPKAGKFVMEVLGRDVCDPTTEVFAYLVLPNAKLSASTEVSFETEMSQAFELTAQQDYCSRDNELFVLIIPED